MSTFVLWNSRTHAIYVYQSDGTPINTFYAQNRIINLALFTISIPQSTPLTLSIIFQSSKIDVLAPVYINKTIFSFKSLYLDALANAVLISSEQVQTISLISLTYYWLCTFLTGRIRTVKLSITLYLNCYNYLTVLPQATAEYVGSLVMLTAQNLFISEQYVFIQN